MQTPYLSTTELHRKQYTQIVWYPSNSDQTTEKDEKTLPGYITSTSLLLNRSSIKFVLEVPQF